MEKNDSVINVMGRTEGIRDMSLSAFVKSRDTMTNEQSEFFDNNMDSKELHFNL